MSSAPPLTEVLVVADCWQTEPDAEAVIHRAINAAAEIADADVGDAELAVMLTDDSGIRTLNSNWRGIDKPTNVLSFPALQPTGTATLGSALPSSGGRRIRAMLAAPPCGSPCGSPAWGSLSWGSLPV